MMEYLDLVDEKGNPTGEIVSRNAAHREGLLHRTAHVWIVRECDGRTQILLQKRSMKKESFPGLFDTSSAGHIPSGCDPERLATSYGYQKTQLARAYGYQRGISDAGI